MGRAICFTLWIQVLNLFRNTLTNTSRIIFNQISEHPPSHNINHHALPSFIPEAGKHTLHYNSHQIQSHWPEYNIPEEPFNAQPWSRSSLRRGSFVIVFMFLEEHFLQMCSLHTRQPVLSNSFLTHPTDFSPALSTARICYPEFRFYPCRSRLGFYLILCWKQIH